MTKQEFEKRKNELKEKLQNAKDEELEEIRSAIEELEKAEVTDEPEEDKKEESTEEEKEETVDERSLLKGAVKNLEKRDFGAAKVIEKPGKNKEEKRMEENEKLVEERANDLKAGKAVKIAFNDEEKRSVTVSGGTLLVPKKYKNSLAEGFNQISGIVDELNTVPLNGGESYSVAFDKGYGEGDYTTEGGNYQDIDVETDYVETGRAKITSYIEVTNEVKKLPSIDYLALISKRVTDAIKKKIGAQVIVGAGTANTIKGIYNADTKVLPTATGTTSDITLSGIDADTLNDITFAYGGSENVETPQTLILTKNDLKAFAKVKATDGRPVYKITKRGTTGTIAYVDDGLTVPFIINSACNSLTGEKTESAVFTMIYGSLSNYEFPVFSDLEVQESTDFKFKQGMIAYRADCIVGGTVSKYKGFVRVIRAAAGV